jgi:hypothetical protein
MVDVNYLAIILAAISSMVWGSLWYGPFFGKPWMKLMGINPKKMNVEPSEMGKLYGIQFLGSLIMAFVLSHALVFAKAYLGTSGLSAGLQTGFWNWIGFVAPVTLTTVLWEGKSWKLWLINNGYYLVMLSTMAIIISLW